MGAPVKSVEAGEQAVAAAPSDPYQVETGWYLLRKS